MASNTRHYRYAVPMAIKIYKEQMANFVIQCLEKEGNSKELIRQALVISQLKRFDRALQKYGAVAPALALDMFPKVVGHYWWETFSWGFDHYVQIREKLWRVSDLHREMKKLKHPWYEVKFNSSAAQLLTLIADILRRINAPEQSQKVRGLMKGKGIDLWQSSVAPPDSSSRDLTVFKNDDGDRLRHGVCGVLSRKNDLQADQRFQDWMSANPRGYVFNNFGGRSPQYNVLHQLPCHSYKSGVNTTYEKICCTDRACIERSIRQVRGDEWKLCGNGCCPPE